MKKLYFFAVLIIFLTTDHSFGQWNFSGSHIYNSNTGFVGIGNNAPLSLLYVAKNMGEPTITVRNLGGGGGATYSMMDDLSGADWKFKATTLGGFKIRDHANSLDVITIEAGSFANALYIKSSDNIGVGTDTPAGSALVDMSSSNKGFLLPRMTTEQRDAIDNPVDGLLIFNLTTGCFNYYFYNTWKDFCATGPIFQCGTTLTVDHVAGAVAPVDKSVSYGTVSNVPGEPSKCWITQNLGSDNQAAAVNDATEPSAGWYWQFNKPQGYKHDGMTRTPNTTWIDYINENSDWLTSNDPCNLLLGSGWRVPTLTEWTNVDAAGSWEDWNDIWDSALKIHAAGWLGTLEGNLAARGSYGDYWTGNQNDPLYGRALFFGNSFCYVVQQVGKATGLPVRCVRD